MTIEQKTRRVRIAVAITHKGAWAAEGRGSAEGKSTYGDADVELAGNASDFVDWEEGDPDPTIHWVWADIPIPCVTLAPDIEGTVE